MARYRTGRKRHELSGIVNRFGTVCQTIAGSVFTRVETEPMPKKFHDDELVAKNGKELQVIVVARISNPRTQDEKSNDDQSAFDQEYLRDRTDLPCHFHEMKTKGSGERTDVMGFREMTQRKENRIQRGRTGETQKIRLILLRIQTTQ